MGNIVERTLGGKRRVASKMQHNDKNGQDARGLMNDKLNRFEALTRAKKLRAGSFMGRHLQAQKKWKPSTAAKSAEKLPQPAIGDGQPGIAASDHTSNVGPGPGQNFNGPEAECGAPCAAVYQK